MKQRSTADSPGRRPAAGTSGTFYRGCGDPIRLGTDLPALQPQVTELLVLVARADKQVAHRNRSGHLSSASIYRRTRHWHHQREHAMWTFWLKWILLNGFGWLIALLLPDLGIPGARLVAFGFIVGIAQAYAMDMQVDDFLWLLSNMFGWTLGFLVAELVLLAYWPDLFTQLAGTFNPYGFVVGSLCSAWLQFIVHWRIVFAEGRVWLIFLYLTAMALAAGYVGGIVHLWMLAFLPTVVDPWQNTLAVLAGFALTGVAYGLVSGLPVFTLLRAAPAEYVWAEEN